MAEKSKTEQLRDLVASLFENATQREQIEGLVKVNTAIDAVEAEQKELTDQNADLIKSYKELVRHTSFRDAPPARETQGATVPSLEASLKDFLANKENKQ